MMPRMMPMVRRRDDTDEVCLDVRVRSNWLRSTVGAQTMMPWVTQMVRRQDADVDDDDSVVGAYNLC